MRQGVSVSKWKHPRYSYRVRFPGPNGETKERGFKTKTDAGIFANELKKEIGREGLAFGVMADEEKAAVTFWRGFVASVPDAAPPPMLTILSEYAERWKKTRSSVTVAAAVDAYEVAKTSEGLRPRSIQGIRTRCGRFARDFGSRLIGSITTPEISDWILSLESTRQRGPIKQKPSKDGTRPQVGLLAKRNHRLAVSGLFTFAKSRGWIVTNPVTDAARPKPLKTRPGILRPIEVSRLFGALEKVSPALIPFWAVRFFAGIREQECLRMDWSAIDLVGGEIHLHDTVTKTGHSRTVKIEPALVAFLTPHVRPDGAIVTASEMGRTYHLRKALRTLKAEDAEASHLAKERGEEPPLPFPVPMPANAARHSFATFHLLAFRHAGETSLQLGHGGSPEMLHRHYKGIATEAESLAFWAIRPASEPANVIKMGHKAVPDRSKLKKGNVQR